MIDLKGRNVFLHIGIPKTGTTAIQDSLWDLQESGILKNYNFQFHYSNLFNIIYQYQSLKYDADWLRIKLNEEIYSIVPKEQECADNVILSNEGFATHFENGSWQLSDMAESLAYALEDYDVKVIVYLRRQDQWVESSVAFSISIGVHSDSFEGHSDGIYYKEFLDSYAKHFGKENLIVRIYDRDFLYNGDVVQDFFHILALDSLINSTNKNRKSNPSLSPECLRVFKAYNAKYKLDPQEKVKRIAFMDKEYKDGNIDENIYASFKQVINLGFDNRDPHRFYNRNLQLLCGTNNHSSSSKGYLKPEERQAILQQYEDDNAAVAREYLGREDGKLFNDKFPENIISLDEPSTTDIVTVFLPIFQHLHEHIQQLENDANNNSGLMQLEQQANARIHQTEIRLNAIERRLGYIKAPWKVVPVIMRRICNIFNLQERAPEVYNFMRSIYRRFDFWK